jgi:hypothetical protein
MEAWGSQRILLRYRDEEDVKIKNGIQNKR